ncbi:MAG: protein-tyrosine phosphatase family protein [Pseudomonadota bacterium]
MRQYFLPFIPCLTLKPTDDLKIPLRNDETILPAPLHTLENQLVSPSNHEIFLECITLIDGTLPKIKPTVDPSYNVSPSLHILECDVEKYLNFSEPPFSTVANIITHHLRFPNSLLYQIDDNDFENISNKLIFKAMDLSRTLDIPQYRIKLNEQPLYDGHKIYLPHTPPIIAISKPELIEKNQFWQYLLHEPQTIVDLSDSRDNYAPTSSHDFLLQNINHEKIQLKSESRIFINPKALGSSLHQTLELTSDISPTNTIDRIHFNKWSDFGIISVKALQNLAKETIKIAHNKYEGQLIVHCRGGIGRTGTFLTYLSVREQIKYRLKNNMTVSGSEIVRLISITNVLGKLYRDIYFIETKEQLGLVFNAVINDVLTNKEILKKEVSLN